MVGWSNAPAVLPILPLLILSVTPNIVWIALRAAASPVSLVHIGEASFRPAIVAAVFAAFFWSEPSAL